MSVYERLGLNFDTNRFGEAQTLPQTAANTLNLVASNIPLTDWQKTQLQSGPINREDYFQNPTGANVASMLISANILFISANTANDYPTMNASANLTIELNNFHSHTDNISGITVSSYPGAPSLGSAQSIGQLNMMTMAGTDGATNTAPILGSFTSLFIPDILHANTVQLNYYANEYANSITMNTDPMTGDTTNSPNLPPDEIANIQNYIISTTNVLYNQRMQDWNFYQNSLQVNKDDAFLQQFNNMGSTMTYLVKNVVGTANLNSKLASSNN